MIVYTDDIDYAERVIGKQSGRWNLSTDSSRAGIEKLSASFFEKSVVYESILETEAPWRFLFAIRSATRSNYDLLVELSREEEGLEDGVLCIVGEGQKLHGFKNRPWSAAAGNIHLSIYLKPERPVNISGMELIVLATVAAVEAIDTVPGLEGRAGIKWVNDILIEDAKIGGVLAYTQTMKRTMTTAVLGIGLNVETTPSVSPTPFVPQVASIADFASHRSHSTQHRIFDELLRSLDRNYRLLLDGHYPRLLERYKERSLVIGREVTICSEDSHEDFQVVARGRVTGVGENLELSIEGEERTVTSGRLILESR